MGLSSQLFATTAERQTCTGRGLSKQWAALLMQLQQLSSAQKNPGQHVSARNHTEAPDTFTCLWSCQVSQPRVQFETLQGAECVFLQESNAAIRIQMRQHNGPESCVLAE